MRVEDDSEREQRSSLLGVRQEGLHALVQQPRLVVDLAWVALARLRQLLSRLDQLVRVRDRVLFKRLSS